jgi:chromosomal replication initiator protein
MKTLSAEEICLLVGNRIKEHFPEAPAAYASTLRARFDDDGSFYLIVGDSFSASKFDTKFRGIVEEIISQFCGINSFSIEIDSSMVVKREDTDPAGKMPVEPELFTNRNSLSEADCFVSTTNTGLQVPSLVEKSQGFGLNPKHTMDSFIVGDSNKFAHAVSLAIMASPGNMYNPLFLYSAPGLGKTHLMQAIGHGLIEKCGTSGRAIAYRTSEVFCNEYIEAARNKSYEVFRKKYREAEALLIDDVQFFCGKEKLLEEFHHTFNELFQSGRQIIMTSDKPPSELRPMPERLISRFKSGIVTEIGKPDLETRIAILKKLASDYSVSPSLMCLESIAGKVTESIRDLEGAFTKVVAMSSVMNVPFSVTMIEEVLAGFEQVRKPTVITLASIKEMVCKHFSVSEDELLGKRRPKRIVIPRQIAMYLSYSLTDQTLQAIGDAYGGRDHTTVVHACNKMEKEDNTGSNIAGDIKVLRIRLKEMIDR